MKTTSYETSQNPELERQVAEAVHNGLFAAFTVHESLGPDGVTAMQPNQFGETALVADVKAEEAVLSALSSINARIEVISEEHGSVIINADNASGSRLLGVLDGLDGSSVYQKERGVGRYGTMFALFADENPRYADYLAAGIMEHSTHRLYLAIKGQPLECIDVITGEVTYPTTKPEAQITPSMVALVDTTQVGTDDKLYDYFNQNGQVFTASLQKFGIQSKRTGSSAASYAAIANGEADIVGESTRKGNLEFATAYAIVTAAGGVMQTLDGTDLGIQDFRTFGQNSHTPILTAANATLADLVRPTLQPA